jgi:hypothetical protein
MRVLRYIGCALLAIPVIILMTIAQWVWGDDRGEP